jgi:hypothetical protein
MDINVRDTRRVGGDHFQTRGLEEKIVSEIKTQRRKNQFNLPKDILVEEGGVRQGNDPKMLVEQGQIVLMIIEDIEVDRFFHLQGTQ